MAVDSPVSFMRCTTSRPIRAATYTRSRPNTDSASRNSRTKEWGQSQDWIKVLYGRRLRGVLSKRASVGLSYGGWDEQAGHRRGGARVGTDLGGAQPARRSFNAAEDRQRQLRLSGAPRDRQPVLCGLP